MTQHNTQPLNANLGLLAVIRILVGLAQILAIYYFSAVEKIALNLAPLFGCAIFMSVFAFATWVRSRRAKAASETEFFIQLCVDMLALSFMLYFSGGASNPFISYLLVPIAIGSSILRWNYSAALAALGLLAYSLLLFYYVPVHALMSHGMGGSLGPHLIGMWFNFVVSALLIAYFIVRMARTISDQRGQLATQREKQLESDRLVSVATLAANTAHQLGTPINTISLMAEELAETSKTSPEHSLTQDLLVQVKRCKETLKHLVNTADLSLNPAQTSTNAAVYIKELIESWSVLHPASHHVFQVSQDVIDTDIYAPPALEPAIFNILDNAIQVGALDSNIYLAAEPDGICLSIRDDGPGIPQEILDNLGKPFNSSKSDGMGIGLYLAMNTAQNLGGSLTFTSSDQGTLVELRLPIMANDKVSK